LKKNRMNRDVLFIDASKEFVKNKNQNKLEDEHIDKIVKTYKKRKTLDKYSYVASFTEVEENDFNLNIPRYVDTFEEEEPVDLFKVGEEMKKLKKEKQEL
ncbi:N-6 DNA methylase, partial [Erysipelothrix rhusiopathiae]|nr:N-6 DNA methylase [Erysipelothrix rhusiopathiae]